MKPVIVSWSGGKDSALTLYEVMNDKRFEVKGLFSTFSEQSSRLPIHEVKRSLIKKQADLIGLPLYEIEMPDKATNEQYEERLGQQFEQWKMQGIHTIVYADLFLDDIRNYRDRLLAKCNMEPLYPLWKRDTEKVAENFLNQGFQSIVTTIDVEKVSETLVGLPYDKEFLNRLPKGVDPCGENGEFHTFVFDGPIFQQPIRVQASNPFYTMNGRFCHIDLM
ncbi:diphthine--ammonia ligase [Halobacillus mangrovi]|uniref:Dph6-related ATP pyrophosphatase n=1 Tax=Halobacillus mangrovi TaxID=402384 RepID=UPI003D95AEDC